MPHASMLAAAVAVLVAIPAGAAPAAKGSKAELLTDPAVAARGGHEGAVVLWGGRIVARTSESGKTCLEIASARLRKSDGRPLTGRGSGGQHFLACDAKAFESKDYSIGHQATIAGTFAAVVSRTVGGDCESAVGNDRASFRSMGTDGCALRLPSVEVSDSRAWPEPPTRIDGATMM